MDKIVLKVKNSKKLDFLMELLKQFDFIEVLSERKQISNSGHSIFSSAGIWKNRDINASDLRKEAWKK